LDSAEIARSVSEVSTIRAIDRFILEVVFEPRTGSPRQLWRLAALLLVATVVALSVQVHNPRRGLDVVASPPQADAGSADVAFTIDVTGEILPHPSVVEHARVAGQAHGAPFDFAPMFADLAPELTAADLSICHLEVPVAPPGTPLSGYPDFGIPAEIGAGIHAGGWDRCSTASNHSNDRGTAGLVATLDALDASQVGHSGTARTEDEAASPPIVDVSGVRVAHLAYTWGFNGTPPKREWMADVIDPDRILVDARRARDVGADLVVVSLHWGDEYDTDGNSTQRSIADRLLASPDIDLLIGHGPHVLQPIEVFHEKYALLSLGNLVANQGSEKPRTYDGMIVTVAFHRGIGGGLVAAAPFVHPTWYDSAAGRVRLIETALADPSLGRIHDALRASFERTRAVVGPEAVITG
jgi:poly-gamma-glutamate synthesis protein (capsule biosynthesis protein)